MTPEQIARSGTEHAHQAALFFQAARHFHLFPELQWMFAIPNGGYRDKITAAKLKAEGVKAGVSDVMLPVPRQGLHGLFIEMKKPGKEKNTSDDQKKFGAFVTEQGYKFVVCSSWVDAWSEIMDYIVE